MNEQDWKRVDELRAKAEPAEVYNDNLLGEFSSPSDLGAAMIEFLQPKGHERIYDGAFGRLGFLLSAKNYIEKNENKKAHDKNFFGREINERTFTSAKMLADNNGLNEGHFYNENSLKTGATDTEKFDVIISNPPFGLRIETSDGELGIKTNDGSNQFIQHYINSLKHGGRAAIIVNQSFFFSRNQASIKLRQYLVEHCNLHTILELPSKTFSHIALGTSVLFFTKGGTTSLIKYYLKKPDEDYDDFLRFANQDVSNDRSFILSVENLQEEGFIIPTASSLAIKKEVEEKTKNFEDFKLYKIDDVCLEINLTKERFEERSNAVYLPKLGKSSPVTHIGDTTLKHQNYFQLVLNDKIIDNGYMAYYLKSFLGQMILESCFTGTTIPSISKGVLVERFQVYAPSLEEQGLIASTFRELAEVKSLMERTAIELSSDPNSAQHILEKLLHTKELFNELSIEEKILKTIKGGENLKVEFKETLTRNLHTGEKDRNLQTTVLKNVVGFLNKSGGQLFIGVADNGEINGIENDYFDNDDKYKLLLSNLINDRIGLNETNYIDIQMHTVRSKKVCLINCSKSNSPAYLDGDFYVRTDPECRKLSAKEASEYIRENFS